MRFYCNLLLVAISKVGVGIDLTQDLFYSFSAWKSLSEWNLAVLMMSIIVTLVAQGVIVSCHRKDFLPGGQLAS